MDFPEKLDLTVLSLPLMPPPERWMWMLKSEDDFRRELVEISYELGQVEQAQRLLAYEKWLAIDRLSSVVDEGRATQVASEAQLAEELRDTPEYRILAQVANLNPDAQVRFWRTLEPGLTTALHLGWSTMEIEPEGEDLDDWMLSDAQAACTHLFERHWETVTVLERMTGLSPFAPGLARRSPAQLLEAFGELHPEASLELRRRLPAVWLGKLLETWDGKPPEGIAEDWMDSANLPGVTLWEWGQAAPIDQALALLESCGISPEAARQAEPEKVGELEMETFFLYPLFLIAELGSENYDQHLKPLLSQEAQRLCPQWAVDGLRLQCLLPFLQEAPRPPWQQWIEEGMETVLAHIEAATQQRPPSPALARLLEQGSFEVLGQVSISTFRHLARAYKLG
ncbi:MAG: hypothetical protein U0931_10040 [Vulcanimicrobiota bacterium]